MGRFRNFIAAYNAWRVVPHPTDGEGANPLISGTGWNTAWNSFLATSSAVFTDASHLNCSPSSGTWTDAAKSPVTETYPVNCLSWYDAFAFCIWDGGRLPTEAEWEYAAGGGDKSLLYPWGNDGTEPLPANYAGNHNTPRLPVGSEPNGNGIWGHSDLAGSVWEWNLDWYVSPYTPTNCVNCAYIAVDSVHVIRGGDWYHPANYLAAANRDSTLDTDRLNGGMGVRCARSIP